MKICFIGSHGVGKTTIAKEIACRLNLTYVPETAIYVKNKYDLPLFPHCTEETQKAIFLKQLKNELLIRSGVFDRSLLDVLAYSIHQNLFDDKILCSMVNITREMIKRFDYIFLVTRFKDAIDKTRYRDNDFKKHMEIEHLMEHLLTCFDLKYYLIFEKNLSDRILTILDLISFVPALQSLEDRFI